MLLLANLFAASAIIEGDSDESINIFINSELLSWGFWQVDSQKALFREILNQNETVKEERTVKITSFKGICWFLLFLMTNTIPTIN